MKKALKILVKHKIILIFHIFYSALVYFVLFYGRSVSIPSLDELTDMAYIQGALSAEMKRILIIWIISGVFYSMIYYLIAKCVQDKRIYVFDLGRGVAQYVFFILLGLLMWIPVTLVFLLCIGILSTPSALITVPLLSGREAFFIPAIILWVITFILIIFATFLYILYIIFWYPGIVLITKNVFAAFKKTNGIVNDNYWRLLGLAFLYIVHFAGFVLVYAQGIRLRYKSLNPFVSLAMWAGVILLSIFSIYLKTYVFVFLQKKSMPHSANHTMA